MAPKQTHGGIRSGARQRGPRHSGRFKSIRAAARFYNVHHSTLSRPRRSQASRRESAARRRRRQQPQTRRRVPTLPDPTLPVAFRSAGAPTRESQTTSDDEETMSEMSEGEESECDRWQLELADDMSWIQGSPRSVRIMRCAVLKLAVNVLKRRALVAEAAAVKAGVVASDAKVAAIKAGDRLLDEEEDQKREMLMNGRARIEQERSRGGRERRHGMVTRSSTQLVDANGNVD